MTRRGEGTRRRRGRLFALAAGMLLLGGIVWFARPRRHRPNLGPGERFGVDVSRHQGTIDWRAVAQDGVRFAYVKATEGGDLVDDHFEANWRGARDAGLDRGAYHFFTLCRSGAEQADNFLRTVPLDASALPPAVDLELVGNCSARPPRDVLLRELHAFVDEVEAATSKKVILYVLRDIETAYEIVAAFDRRLWVPSLLRRPQADGWQVWQVDSEARVGGIEGGVDLDVMIGP